MKRLTIILVLVVWSTLCVGSDAQATGGKRSSNYILGIKGWHNSGSRCGPKKTYVDCKGKINGSAKLDICGVCAGNGTSCLDCNGMPFGTASVDQCGVCGGHDDCLDCKGVPNGTAVVDRCGVCEGDGKSCLGCTTIDQTNLLFTLDGNSLKQKANVLKATERLGKLRSDVDTVRFIKNVQKELDKLQLRNWQLAWSLPKVVATCTNTQLCAAADDGGLLDEYVRNAAALRDLSKKVLRRIERVAGGLRVNDKKLGIAAERLYGEVITAAGSAPRVHSVC